MEERQLRISTANTYLNIAAIIVLIGGVYWLTAKLAKIESDILIVRSEVMQMQERMELKMSIKMGDRWTGTMMGVWGREFQKMNGTNRLEIPVVQKIQQEYPPGAPP